MTGPDRWGALPSSVVPLDVAAADPRERGSRRQCVAHVTLGLDMGGQEKLLVEFARHLDRRRFRQIFVCLGAQGVLAPSIEGLGWPVYCLNQKDGLHLNLVLRLARLFRRERVRIVHTHDVRPLIYGAFAARLGVGRQVIHTQHGQELDLPSRRLLLLRMAARRADRFVCVSHDAACIARKHGMQPAKVMTIQNGIDTDRFSELSPSPDGALVTVARLSPEKDISTLLKAVAIARRDAPSLRLDIVGNGPCLSVLQQQSRELGVWDCVRFVGEVMDVAPHLNGARLFVLASISEGISLTLLEAMSAGLPVVATCVGGTPEVVRDGETGLLVPASNPQALAAGIVRLWNDPAERDRLACAGRHHVVESFSVRKMVREYESLYLAPYCSNSRGIALFDPADKDRGVAACVSGGI